MGDSTSGLPRFSADESFAQCLDGDDPLAAYRDRFLIPTGANGRHIHYLAGNSLGLQPRTVRGYVDRILKDWAERAVDGHFQGDLPWYPFHEMFRDCGARLVGATPGEVVVMNSLTVNLHLMMVSFYRPTRQRYKILIEDPAFPSDSYAVQTQARFHGHDPKDGLVIARPRAGQRVLSHDDIEELLGREGEQIALVMLSGVNFVTGQVLDMARITRAAKRHGCAVGFDLAHAAGNVPLHLHDWDVDFAVWCNYKYLNSGPGAVGACFVHQRHHAAVDLPRFAGWWGNDPATRFRMQLETQFVPRISAEGWQVSNPPILAMAPVKASYDIFDEVGMDALRVKSQTLTAYMQFLLDELADSSFDVITPRVTDQRGCQLSLALHRRSRELLDLLHTEGVVCDFREPNIIRAAPVPLYNSFYDVWAFVNTLSKLLRR